MGSTYAAIPTAARRTAFNSMALPLLDYALRKAEARVSGRDLSQLFCLEIFAGSARLTAQIRLLGMADSLGVDHKLQTSLPVPVLSLDLQQSSAREIVMTIFDSPNLVYVHLAPPCKTASRAM